MIFMIWYQLKNSKNVILIHGRVLILVKLQASAWNFTKSNTRLTLDWFLTCFKFVQMVPNQPKRPIYTTELSNIKCF